MKRAAAILISSLPLWIAACSDPHAPVASQTSATATATVASAPAAPAAAAATSATGGLLPTPAIDTQPLDVPPIQPSAAPVAQAIDQAAWSATPGSPEAKRNAMIRAEVLLARAHFSPGVVDGQDGGNVRNAIAAFETAHGLPADGQLDDQVWQALTADAGPVVTDYAITAEDVAGPFLPRIPTDLAQMAKLPHLSFTSPLEALAEKFHMDEALLKALNPGADLSQAGTRIVVVAPGPRKLAGKVTRIEVDKTARQVRAYGEADKLLAVYPATVGSTERPAPSGEWAVRTVAVDPTYTYDPSRLTFGKAKEGKLTIPAGPNNPVGSTWIDLTKDTYGIHGAPDPRLVGKTASHGCVRLTNWDVRQLGEAVQKGAKVQFVGEARPSATAKTSA